MPCCPPVLLEFLKAAAVGIGLGIGFEGGLSVITSAGRLQNTGEGNPGNE